MTEWQRFHKAADLFETARNHDARRREAFLREACADDPDLLDQVRRLLEHHEDPDAPLETPLLPEQVRLDMFPSLDAPPIPDRIGRYRVKGQLGIGGMGVVYLAEQDRPRREVAIKVLRPGIASRELLRRFEFEAAALARLQHPGIAQVYEVGAFDAGAGPRPFFVMEHIEGEPLTRYADGHALSTRQRLELVVAVCDAVHHAHQRGVIHRDIKPGNILVNAAGQPRILDFGVARATDSDLQVTTMQTGAGQLIGTLPYMSPEQLLGQAGEVDVRSDVYAIGVTLYELLTGRLPFDLSEATLLTAARELVESEPAPPSAANRLCRGDLDTIVGKALAKAPDRRYQAASSLAADIRRYLGGEPIVARPATTLYQLRKFAGRNRGLVAGVVAASLALIAGTIVSTALAIGQARAQRDATQRADDLGKVVAFQAVQISRVDPHEMGVQLRDAVLAQLRDARGPGAPDAQRAVEGVSRALAPVNFTDVALRTLDATLFSPTLAAIEAQFPDQPLVRAELYQSMTNTLRDIGLLDLAMDPQQRALDIRRELLGPDDPKTLDSINSTGLLLKVAGRYQEAETYYDEALAGRRRVLGDDHLETLTSMINSGLLHKTMGRITEAEALFREAYERSPLALGPDHWMNFQAANNLGVVAESRGRADEALEYYRIALEGRRRTLGDDHPDTLTSINNMGVALIGHGRYDEALPYLEETLRSRRRVLGGTHPATLTSISNMGVILRRQGKPEEAEPYYREALTIRRETLGDRHPATLRSIGNMANFLLSNHDLEGATALYREALDGRRETLGPAHPNTLESARYLATTLTRRQRFVEAERVLEDAYEDTRDAHGDARTDTAQVCRALAELHVTWDQAEPGTGHDQAAAAWRTRAAPAVESEAGG